MVLIRISEKLELPESFAVGEGFIPIAALLPDTMSSTEYVQAETEDEASNHGTVLGYTPPSNGMPGFYTVEVDE